MAQTLLQKIGSDIKKVFTWLGSPGGAATIIAGETVVSDIFPEASGILAIANAGLQEIIKIESLAAGAGSQNGSGAVKSAAVISVLTPEILAYAEQNKLPVPTADKIQTASNALVAFLNTFAA